MKRDRQPSIQRSTVAMEVSFCSLLLLVATIGASHGDQDQKESRVYQRLNSFCDDLDDLNKMLARKRYSLEKHAFYLRTLADDVHKAHTEATEDQVFWSKVAVGGDIFNIVGLVLDYMQKSSPYISAVGKFISIVGEYHQEKESSSEQEQWVKAENNVFKIFKQLQDDLREITDMYYEIKEKLHDFKEEGLLGTLLHEKLMEIKKKFSLSTGLKIEPIYVDMTSQCFNLMLKLDENAGKFQSANYKTAAASLYHNGKKLYKGILHLNDGARSELAENISEVVAYLESVIEKLDRFLQKTST